MSIKGVMRIKRHPMRILLVSIVVVALVLGSTSVGLAQSPIPSLKTVPVPEPDNLGDFVKDRAAAIRLGKAFFWDMQVGSDGIQSCATCHFNSGADSRSKNQLSPGLLRVDANGDPDSDYTFDKGVNYQLTPGDFPFHKLADPNDRNSAVLADTNDLATSQGVFYSIYEGVISGQAEDLVAPEPDGVFQVGGCNVRQCEPRHTPGVFNAVHNFRNFWDGRAQNDFNGVNPFGSRDPNAYVYKAVKNGLVKERVSLNNSSLASQAVAPPLSSFEMSADGRPFPDIGSKFSKSTHKLGQKLLPLRPLAKQFVHPEDSVLGTYSRPPLPGLAVASYEEMIKAAFKPEWWKYSKYIQIDPDGSQTIVSKKATGETYSQMEYNFSLFFGLAVQMYEATLVSDNAPIDRYAEGDESALTDQQKRGLDVFILRGCPACHNGPEFTDASVRSIDTQGLTRPFIGGRLFDRGFMNIGVRPTLDDLGVGGTDPFGTTLSEARLSGSNRTAVLGAFKVPGLRNVGLTAPYMHNGGLLTLKQVLDFYGRNGDFRTPGSPNEVDFLGLFRINFGDDPATPALDVDPDRAEQEKQDLVAFLEGALTDERVPLQQAPFDHPQLFVPNGHPGDTLNVADDDGDGYANDELMEIPAVGLNGGSPLKGFLEP